MKEKILYLILALLIYLPTCAYVPLSTYLVLILISIFLVKDFLLEFWKGLLSKKIIDKNFAVLLFVALFAMILRLVDYSNWESINDFYSFAYFFPFTYLVAKSLIGRTEVFKYIVLLVAIEVVLGIIQYT